MVAYTFYEGGVSSGNFDLYLLVLLLVYAVFLVVGAGVDFFKFL